MKTKTWLALVAALGLIALASCGSDDEQSTSSASGNSTDAAFMADMTTHHQGAIEMAVIAKDRAEHREIRELADNVVSGQEGEISVMKTIRRDMHNMDEHGNGHMGMSDEDMGIGMDPAELKDAKPFDRAFIDMMVPHHQGAIAMAEQLLKKGEQPALLKLAQDMIDEQSKEIAEMREWRKDWYGSAKGSEDSMHGSDHDMDMGG